MFSHTYQHNCTLYLGSSGHIYSINANNQHRQCTYIVVGLEIYHIHNQFFAVTVSEVRSPKLFLGNVWRLLKICLLWEGTF